MTTIEIRSDAFQAKTVFSKTFLLFQFFLVLFFVFPRQYQGIIEGGSDLSFTLRRATPTSVPGKN